MQTVLHNGLHVTPRLQNYTGVTADSIAWELAQVQSQCTPASLGPLIFAGSAALGNRGLLQDTSNALAADNMVYGTVEFGKMEGDDSLTRMANALTVRVHSIGSDEMLTMDEPTAIERFVRAARERNIRVCYVRLFTSGLEKNSDVIGANVEFVQSIVKGLRQAHFTIGPAHPYDRDPKPGLVLRVLMACGVFRRHTPVASDFYWDDRARLSDCRYPWPDYRRGPRITRPDPQGTGDLGTALGVRFPSPEPFVTFH